MYILALAALVIPPPMHTAPAKVTDLVLAKPIACTIGQDCLIQQYFDHDGGPGASDYTCGTASYNGLDGTEFRLPDKTAQARGVAVLAAADGVVTALRDGEADFAAGAFNDKLVKGKECGNGVVLRHANGWETQYCHMRQGSVAVHIGQAVQTGDTLGLVGQSGESSFINLHFAVRRDGERIDPFGPDAACHDGADLSASLWRPQDRAELAWRDAETLNMGFANRVVSTVEIEDGGIAPPDTSSPGLVVYARAINLHKGDVLALVLRGPDGELSRQETLPLDHNKAQYVMSVGKTLTTKAWIAGDYHGTFAVIRGDRTIFTRTVDLRLD